MMRVNWREYVTVTVFTVTESYTVTIRCTSTKSMVELGSKSAAAKAAVAAAVATALASVCKRNTQQQTLHLL